MPLGPNNFAKSLNYVAVILLSCLIMFDSASGEIALPKDYHKSYTFYHRIDDIPKKQVREFYINDVMRQSLSAGEMPRPGSIVVLEVYNVRRRDDGQLEYGTNGKIVAEDVMVISTMELPQHRPSKSATLSADDWLFEFYSKEFEKKSTGRDRADCKVCHGKVHDQHGLFTFEQMLRATR